MTAAQADHTVPLHPEDAASMIEGIKSGKTIEFPSYAKKKTNGKKRTPDHAECADHFVRECFTYRNTDMLTLRFWRDSWYDYNDQGGWRPMSEREVESRIMKFMRERPEYREHATQTYVSSMKLHLRSGDVSYLPESFNMPIWLKSRKNALNWVRFNNGKIVNMWRYAERLAGVKEWDDGDVEIGYTPNLFSHDNVKYEFDTDNHPGMFHDYLDKIMPVAEDQELLRRMTGLLLVDSTAFDVFFYLYGPTSRNGKTVFLEVLRDLVGRNNMSFVGLERLIDKFETWPLTENKVNVCGDMATDIGRSQLAHVEGEFKDCVSGKDIEYQKKNKDKYNAPCRARFLFAGNDLPTFMDKSDAIWERMRIVHFPVHLEEHERDPHLAEKIIATDLPGICMWALDGLSEVISQSGVKNSPAGKQLRNQHQLICDHEASYLHEFYEYADDDSYVAAKEMRDEYVGWMNENGYKGVLGAGRFYSRVARIMKDARAVPKLRMKRPDGTPYVSRGFKGMRRRGDYEGMEE